MGYNFIGIFDHVLESPVRERFYFQPQVKSKHSHFKEKKMEDGTSVYFAELDLPGVKLEDISVECDDRCVTIKAERKTNNSVYSIDRSFNLLEKFDPETLEAHLDSGVLALQIKEVTQEKPRFRKINVLNKKD